MLTPRGLTINDFEALYHLYRADEQRLRRIDLVNLLMLTPSGVTRLLEGSRRMAWSRTCSATATTVSPGRD